MRASHSAVKAAVQAAMASARQSMTGWWRTNCPECAARTGKPDRKQCLAINARSGVFKCWKCSLKGRLDGFVDPIDQDRQVDASEVPPPEGFTFLSTDEGRHSASLAAARDYLSSRVDEAVWWEAGLGACATGPYAGRVVVPVLAVDGSTWLGWVGRTWYPSDLTYTYPRGMNRGAVLYNQWVLEVDDDSPVLVVEGVFDALHLWPRAVALLGKASEHQMELLSASRHPVVVVLDGDAWAEGAAMAMRLRMHGQRAGSVRLPPRLDPDEVDAAWLDEEVRRAL